MLIYLYPHCRIVPKLLLSLESYVGQGPVDAAQSAKYLLECTKP